MQCQLARGAFLRSALLFAFAVAPVPAVAGAPGTGDAESDGLEVSGSLRVRGEALDGQFRPGKAENNALLLLRTALLVRYTAGPVQIVGELMDARAYGQDPDTPIGTGDVNALEPLQAYIELGLDPIIRGAGRVKAGRFTMQTGAGRLIARADYANFPNAFTGATADLSTPGEGGLQLFWTMPSIRLPKDAEALQDNEAELDRSTTDLQFYGAHLTQPLFAGVEGEIYAYQLTEEDADLYPTRNRDLITYGARANRAPAVGTLDFDVEYARQDGTIRASTSQTDTDNLQVSASFLHAEAGYRFVGAWVPRLSAHYDFASGDGPDADYNRFDGLFGGRRGEFGPTGIFGPAGRSNLISGGVRLEAKPSKRLDLMTMYRALWLDEATDSFASTGVRESAGASGTWAGHQAELRVRYWIMPDRLRLEGGGAYLAKGRFLREAPNAPASGDTRFVYLSLSANF